MWQTLKDWFRNSVTILWARVVAALGLTVMALQSLAQDPAVSQAIQTVLEPRYIPYYVIAIGLITELARRRSLDRT